MTWKQFILILMVVLFIACRKEPAPPIKLSIFTSEASNITSDSATLGGVIAFDGGNSILERGVCWTTTGIPTVNNNKQKIGNGIGIFGSNVIQFNPNTIYHVRAYAINGNGTYYGEVISFRTLISTAKISTLAITGITQTTAISGGTILSDGGAAITQRGVCWSTLNGPTILNNKTSNGTGTGVFAANVTPLVSNTIYYLRAYATNSAGTSYGNEVSFKTNASLPILSTNSINTITVTTAISGGIISSDGGAPITEKGVCWGVISGPTVANSKTSNGTGTGSFLSNISSLNPNTVYYVRAYATNTSGTAYGNEISFKTNASLPIIITSNISSIAQTTAISGGTISTDGGAPIIQRGVCWNIVSTPTITNSKTLDGAGTGSFTSTLASLLPNTIYYVRAYAINASGTAYGNEMSFKTSPGTASISSVGINSITQTSAFSGGIITNDGGAFITQKGVCWNTVGVPTIANSKTSNGTGIGSFTSSLTPLIPNTLYYVRAYATNSAGTSYGNELAFRTTAYLPTIITLNISTITQTTSISGGNITFDGGAPITERGVCWNTSSGPVIANNRTINGTGTGSYLSNIISLIPNTVYFVRAYARNIAGTAYGNEVAFKTLPNLPTVTTMNVSLIGQTFATLGGTVLNDGGSTVSQRGVCWNTTSSPTINNGVLYNGNGLGSFSATIGGLIPNTTYFVRAFASNSGGINYGNETNFNTSAIGIPTLSTPSSNSSITCCNINFGWTIVLGATSYEINISRNSTFSGVNSTIAVCGSAANPSLTNLNTAVVTNPNFCMNTGSSTTNGIWYWRVRAKIGNYFGGWSVTRAYIKI